MSTSIPIHPFLIKSARFNFRLILRMEIPETKTVHVNSSVKSCCWDLICLFNFFPSSLIWFKWKNFLIYNQIMDQLKCIRIGHWLNNQDVIQMIMGLCLVDDSCLDMMALATSLIIGSRNACLISCLLWISIGCILRWEHEICRHGAAEKCHYTRVLKQSSVN